MLVSKREKKAKLELQLLTHHTTGPVYNNLNEVRKKYKVQAPADALQTESQKISP